MLTAAVVGAGLMGQWHARALRRAGHHLSLVVDPDENRARALARHFPRCRTTVSVEDLHASSVHAVHVCTPVASHAPIVATALESGAHVLCEKPLATDAASTARLLELARSRDRLLCPVHQALFQQGVRQALAGLSRIGLLVHVELTMCTAGAEGRNAPEKDEVVAEILPHPIALLGRLLPEALEAAWEVQRPAPGELRAAAVVNRSGASIAPTAAILISTSGRPIANAAILIGTDGTIRLDLFHGFSTFQSGATSRLRKAMSPFVAAALTGGGAAANLARRVVRRQSAYPGLWELVRLFYEAAASSKPAPISPHETLAVAALRDRILSARGPAYSRPGTTLS